MLDFWLRHVATAEDAAAKDGLVNTGAEAFLDILAREMYGDWVPQGGRRQGRRSPRGQDTA
jgi:hypothetical protein